jgi:hypothetical protein
VLHFCVSSIREIFPAQLEPAMATLPYCTPALESLTLTLNTTMRTLGHAPTGQVYGGPGGQCPVQSEPYTLFQSRCELEKTLPRLRMVHCVDAGSGYREAFGNYIRQKLPAAVEGYTHIRSILASRYFERINCVAQGISRCSNSCPISRVGFSIIIKQTDA